MNFLRAFPLSISVYPKPGSREEDAGDALSAIRGLEPRRLGPDPISTSRGAGIGKAFTCPRRSSGRSDRPSLKFVRARHRFGRSEKSAWGLRPFCGVASDEGTTTVAWIGLERASGRD